MFNRLVVGDDGSAQSRGAVLWAIEEAALRGARLEVVTCVSAPILSAPWTESDPSPQFDVTARAGAARDELDRVIALAGAEQPGMAVEGTVVVGHALDVLAARARSADLLVVGAESARRVERGVLGSTALGLMYTSPCPVVVVPSPARPRTSGPIVVGTDGSPFSDAALEWAADEAQRRGDELLVVHVWWYPYPELSVEKLEWARTQAGAVLDAAVTRCRDRADVPVAGRLVEHSPTATLLDLSSQSRMVVVGSHSRGRIRARLFGSVAYGVAAHALWPVVVVRPGRRG